MAFNGVKFSKRKANAHLASLSKKKSVNSVGETGFLDSLGRDKGQALTSSAFDQAIREDLQPRPSDCDSNSGGGDREWFSGL